MLHTVQGLTNTNHSDIIPFNRQDFKLFNQRHWIENMHSLTLVMVKVLSDMGSPDSWEPDYDKVGNSNLLTTVSRHLRSYHQHVFNWELSTAMKEVLVWQFGSSFERWEKRWFLFDRINKDICTFGKSHKLGKIPKLDTPFPTCQLIGSEVINLLALQVMVNFQRKPSSGFSSQLDTLSVEFQPLLYKSA